MGRQIKSVSIPERLHERMKDIPNFSQWVIQALEAENEGDRFNIGMGIERAAANRRRHIRDLEDIIDDLRNIAEDLKTVQKTPPHHRQQAAKVLQEQVIAVADLWAETLTIRRKQA